MSNVKSQNRRVSSVYPGKRKFLPFLLSAHQRECTKGVGSAVHLYGCFLNVLDMVPPLQLMPCKVIARSKSACPMSQL